MFPNVTESLILLYKDPKPFVKQLLLEKQKAMGITSKEINEKLGVKSNGGGMWSIYTGKNVCKQMPTKDVWHKLQNILEFDIPYDKISQTFNTQLGITDVWDDIDFYSEIRYHPTQKPQKLLKRIIESSSNKNDIVLDPFIGGGSTAQACVSTNRRYIGFEIDEKYFNVAKERIKNAEQME